MNPQKIFVVKYRQFPYSEDDVRVTHRTGHDDAAVAADFVLDHPRHVVVEVKALEGKVESTI